MRKWYERPEPVSAAQITSKDEADVVVIGLGYSGTAAARAAVECGAEVIALEAMTEERYKSYGRDIGHINSAFLASRGVPPVDPIDLYNEMMRRASNRANPALVMKFCQNCGKAFDWLTDAWGVEGLKDVHVAFWPDGAEKFKANVGMDYNGYHFWNGTAQFPDPRGWPGSPTLIDVMRKNHEKIRALGGRLHFSTEAADLEQVDGRVTGVLARQKDGNYIYLRARKGVVLAAGDFSGNREMMQDLVTDIGDLLRPDQEYPRRGGRKGQGIQMGVWAGGRLEPRPLAIMGGNYTIVAGFTTFASLWLDREGKRYCNEVFGGPELAGFAGTQMPQGTYYSVFDEHVLEDLAWSYPAHGGFDSATWDAKDRLEQIMQNAIEHPQGHPDSMKPMAPMAFNPFVADNIYSGDTPEELVENAGLTGELGKNAVASIHRYIQVCEQGRDDDFGKAPQLLRPFSGRLFLQKSEIAGNLGFTMATVGGLVTDADQNVLDRNYERIPGLYATGNCCGRRFGSQYTTPISGVSISMAVTLGREVGQVFSAHDEKK